MTNTDLVESLRASGVLSSPHIAAAFRAIDRADFVPADLSARAYDDAPLPIGQGQTISQPWTVAFMLEKLQPHYGEKILDIGAGSGWQTALLAHIVSTPIEAAAQPGKPGRVVAVEVIPTLAAFARENISKYNFIEHGVVTLEVRNAHDGLQSEAPFHKIIAAAAGDYMPSAWLEQLTVGGILVVPVDRTIVKIAKQTSKEFVEESYPGFAFVPLV